MYLSNSTRPRIPHIHLESFLDNIFKNDNFDRNIFERYEITDVYQLIHHMETWNTGFLQRFQHSKKEYYEMITKKIKVKKNSNPAMAQVQAQAETNLLNPNNYFSLSFDKTDEWLSNSLVNITHYPSVSFQPEFLESIEPYLTFLKKSGSGSGSGLGSAAPMEVEGADAADAADMASPEIEEIMDIDPSPVGKKRKNINKTVKHALWTKYYGKNMEGLCYVCETNLINCFSFEAGHVIAAANGGSDNINNLRPICKSCNGSMGTQNLEAFKEHFFTKK
jgi:hypothetical protein